MDWNHHVMGMTFFWIFLFAGFILLVFLIRRQDWSGGGGKKESPLDILKRRFAKGEIDEGQYRKMRKDLEA